jgi:hypothetical protein
VVERASGIAVALAAAADLWAPPSLHLGSAEDGPYPGGT